MELKRPLVSVVISTYNSREPLKKAITSVINQTYDNIEIIIVDNHSTDDTEQLILEMNVSNILYVCLPENSNGCVPRNRGILASNGRFIAFLHSDDSWLPTKIEYQMASIEQHAKNFDNILCFTDLIIETKHWKKQIRNTSFNEQQMSIMDYMIAQQNIVQTSTYIVSATLAKRSLFNEQLTTHQDWDFCMRLERNGAQFIHCPSFLTVWQCDVRNDSRSVREKYYNASLQWFEQHQQELSKKAQLGYKLHFIFPELLRNKQFKKMVHLLVESRKTHQLSTFHLMKKMTLIGLYATKLKKFNRETRAVE